MDVIHRLAGGGAAVGHEPVAALGDALASGNPGRNSHKMPQDDVVLIDNMVKRRHVFARNYDDVRRRLRVYVPKCNNDLVFMHSFRRNLARDDPAKNAI